VTTQGSIVVALLALMLLGFIVNLLRKRRLSEEVSLIWIFACVAAVLFMALPGLTAEVTHLVGAIYPASMLTLLALTFVGVMLIYTSVKLSKLTAEVRALAQRQVLADAAREEAARAREATKPAGTPPGAAVAEGAGESRGQAGEPE